jgi:O-antigen/teichoic acid export membrane protein
MSGHGVNVVLNIFFGPAVNAGRSIASQANGAIYQFVANVQAAINPQIVKQYAAGEQAKMHELVQQASKYNFFLLLLLATPVLIYTEGLLNIWLVDPPEYAATFLQLTIIASLIESLSRPMMTAAQATGKIRLYQSVIGGLLLLNVPLAFLVLAIWQKPAMVILVSILLELIALIVRLFIMRHLTGMAVIPFLKLIISRVAIVALATATVSYSLVFSLEGEFSLIMGLAISFISTLFVIYFLGLREFEKKYLKRILVKSYRKLS